MTNKDFRHHFYRWLTPNFIKRRQIRPLLAELNRRIELRNLAYEDASPNPFIKDDLDHQDRDSLDITFDFIQTELDFADETEHYKERIAENADRKARRIAREEAEKAIELAAHTIEKEKDML